MSSHVGVADLCAHPLLREAPVIGAAGRRRAGAVHLVLPARVLSEPLERDAAIVLALDGGDPTERRGHLVDVVLRRAHEHGCPLLVVVGAPQAVPAATQRLALRLEVALVLAPEGVSSLELVVALRETVQTPQLAVAAVVLDLAGRLQRPQASLDALLGEVVRAVGGTAGYACAGSELVLAGRPGWTTPAEAVRHQRAGSMARDDLQASVLPVEVVSGEVAAWLVVEAERVGRVWLDSAAAALLVAHGPVVALLARQQAARDQADRLRTSLLTELIESRAGVSSGLREQCAELGWQLDGWHTAVHVQVAPGELSAVEGRVLAERLRACGLPADTLVRRTDGWVVWQTHSREPGPEHVRALGTALESVLDDALPGHRLSVGIGSPQRDVEGIAVTLGQARQAVTLAAAGNRRVAVRVLQDAGTARLLLGWYSSDAFADYARELLAPLVDSGDVEVLRTLEAFLDRACSTSHTARALGVHRNTVLQRVSKAERLLGLNTSSADARLALQLAIRLHKSHPVDDQH